MALYDIAGYWQPLLAALDSMTSADSSRSTSVRHSIVSDDPEQLVTSLSTWTAPARKWARSS